MIIDDIFSIKEWMMLLEERLFVIGVTAIVKPDKFLEIGVYYGKLHDYIKDYCKEIHCVDINDVRAEPKHELFYNMTSDDFFKENSHIKFGLILVDADHTYPHAYADMKNALKSGKIILCHDAINPECRRGYETAIKEADNIKYCNLDAFRGSGEWGGIGLIETND